MRKAEEDKGSRFVEKLLNVISGAALGLILCFLILLAASYFISTGNIREGLMYRIALGACFAGSCLGSLFSIRRNKTKALLSGIATGVSMFLIMLILGVLIYSEMDTGELGMGFFIASLLGGIAGSFLSTMRKKRRK